MTGALATAFTGAQAWLFESAVQPLLDAVDIDRCGIHSADENEIEALPVDVVAPERNVRKDLRKCGKFTLHCIFVAFVQLDELAEDTAGIQVLLNRFEKLFCI